MKKKASSASSLYWESPKRRGEARRGRGEAKRVEERRGEARRGEQRRVEESKGEHRRAEERWVGGQEGQEGKRASGQDGMNDVWLHHGLLFVQRSPWLHTVKDFNP
eukprot:SAG11_NODE_1387_length_5065_cov_12.530099_5_plen_106_part_00